MIFDPNDPRLTAYVLGELDPADCAAIEAMLKESPQGCQEIAEIRQTVEWLGERLHDEQAFHSAGTRVNDQVVAANPPKLAPAPRPWWRRSPIRLVGLAALLLLAVTVSFVSIAPSVRHAPKQPEQVALFAEPKTDFNTTTL